MQEYIISLLCRRATFKIRWTCNTEGSIFQNLTGEHAPGTVLQGKAPCKPIIYLYVCPTRGSYTISCILLSFFLSFLSSFPLSFPFPPYINCVFLDRQFVIIRGLYTISDILFLPPLFPLLTFPPSSLSSSPHLIPAECSLIDTVRGSYTISGILAM